MAVARAPARFHRGAVADSFGHSMSAKKDHKTSNHAERYKVYCKSWSRRSARADLRTNQVLYFGELPGSPDSIPEPPSISESDEDDFDYGALVEAHQFLMDRYQAEQLYEVYQPGCNSGSSCITQTWHSRPNKSWEKPLATQLVAAINELMVSKMTRLT